MIASDARIWVAGEHGMVGKAVYAHLRQAGYSNLIHSPRRCPDLTNSADTLSWMKATEPEVVVMTAGKVGGIVGNKTYPVEFLLDNVLMACNVIQSAATVKVRKLLYLGSSCIYPRSAPQPMKPEHLLSSALEKTNEGYALAKIVGVRLCQYYRQEYGLNFIAAMPCNLYGPGDRYHATDSHVIPALIMKFHDALQANASSVTCLGDGSPQREFLYVDDLAQALVKLLNEYDGEEIVNVGSGVAVTIRALAELVRRTVGFRGETKWSGDKAVNGTPVKLLDSSAMLGLGWSPRTSLAMGLQLAYEDFKRRDSEIVDVEDENAPRWMRRRHIMEGQK